MVLCRHGRPEAAAVRGWSLSRALGAGQHPGPISARHEHISIKRTTEGRPVQTTPTN